MPVTAPTPPPSLLQTGCDGVWNACGCDRHEQLTWSGWIPHRAMRVLEPHF
jgi:hypothetical protein